MNENDLYNILQKDDNLREAIRRREQKLPPMPDGLKERPLPLPLPREGRTKSLRWIRQDGVGDLKSPEAIKNHRIANPNTQDSRITNSTEPKAMAVAESKTVRKSKKKAAPIQTASIEQKDSSLFTLYSSLQKNDSSLFTHNSSLTPPVLTERDIPITRPENYRYTPEEIALLKKQADDAYVKWVQLELEIAKYNLEQMAQQ